MTWLDLDKSHLGQDLPGDQTKSVLDLNMALSLKIKLLNLTDSNWHVTLLVLTKLNIICTKYHLWQSDLLNSSNMTLTFEWHSPSLVVKKVSMASTCCGVS